MANQIITEQMPLFHIEKQVEIDSIEMGVLDSGVPYLTGRGLERMCGVGHGPFHRLTTNWQEEKNKPRGIKNADDINAVDCVLWYMARRLKVPVEELKKDYRVADLSYNAIGLGYYKSSY